MEAFQLGSSFIFYVLVSLPDRLSEDLRLFGEIFVAMIILGIALLNRIMKKKSLIFYGGSHKK
ncbi:hypothetical protein ACFL08_00405 [Patescibacteria group bacterium]